MGTSLLAQLNRKAKKSMVEAISRPQSLSFPCNCKFRRFSPNLWYFLSDPSFSVSVLFYSVRRGRAKVIEGVKFLRRGVCATGLLIATVEEVIGSGRIPPSSIRPEESPCLSVSGIPCRRDKLFQQTELDRFTSFHLSEAGLSENRPSGPPRSRATELHTTIGRELELFFDREIYRFHGGNNS